MSALTGGKVLRYAVLPEFWPRIRALVGSGFSHLAFLIAIVYQNVGLLPAGNAFTHPQNFGRFGIRHVIAAASNNLVISWRNADKVIIFFTILFGLMVLFLQLVLLIFTVVAAPAFANPWTDMFVNTTAGPKQDIAFIVLDQIFGVMDVYNINTQGFFRSCYADTAVSCLNIRNRPLAPDPAVFPLPFHHALHQMFLFYSLGIAFVAGVVIMYSVVAIIGETVTSGTPFGQRFNKAWFIPRLLMFFALIAPISLVGNNAGINGGQYVTLAVARFGSNMATNAWEKFAASINTQYGVDNKSTIFGSKETLIAFPNVPSVAKLTQFMYLVRMCMYAEKILNNIDVRPYIVREMDIHPLKGMGYTPFVNFLPYLGMPAPINMAAPSFDDAVKFSRYGNVVLRFGELNLPAAVDPLFIPGNNEREWGYVKPICGELTFDTTAYNPIVTGTGAQLGIQNNYYVSIREYLLYDPTFEQSAYCMVRAVLPYDQDPTCVDKDYNYPDFNSPTMWHAHSAVGNFLPVAARTGWVTRDLAKKSIDYYDAVNRYYINGNFSVEGTSFTSRAPGTPYDTSIIGGVRQNYDFTIPPEILSRGWVGMSLYYQKIAEINGLVFGAVQNTPTISKFPLVMEVVGKQHDQIDTNPDLAERFNPLLSNGKLAELPRPGDQYIAAALYSGFKFWQDDKLTDSKKSGNPVIDVINVLFGTEGLFNMLENKGVHPLAELSALGKSMLDSSIRNVFMGSAIGLVSDVMQKKFSMNVGSLPQVAGDFVSKVGMIGISIGFLLYYVLPLLPFVYFFFAFSGWVKSIFEAMVAVPLWALAHIKIDGQGLPGPWATNGYFLLFEIFLRPTLIVFGFLASITIFAAFVSALNSVYDAVVLSVSGYDMEANVFAGPQFTDMGNSALDMMRSPIDQLFYTVIYAMLVYMFALSSFKLIDQIPNSILRFMGVTVSTFQERGGDVGEDLTGRMSRTSQVAKAQLGSAIDRIKGVVSDSVSPEDLLRQQQSYAANKSP